MVEASARISWGLAGDGGGRFAKLYARTIVDHNQARVVRDTSAVEIVASRINSLLRSLRQSLEASKREPQ